MLSQFDEEDYYYFKKVACTRLDIHKMVMFKIMVCGMCLFALIFVIIGYVQHADFLPVFHGVNILFVLYIIVSLVLILLFFNDQFLRKHQTMQAIILVGDMFVMSIVFYLICIVFIYNGRMGPYLTRPALINILFVLFAIGILVYVWAFLWAIQLIKKGQMRPGGPGFFNIKDMKKANLNALFATCIGVLVVAVISEMIFGEPLIKIYAVATIIYFAIAVASPEFIFIAYCKSRFPSFHVQPDEMAIDFAERVLAEGLASVEKDKRARMTPKEYQKFKKKMIRKNNKHKASPTDV